MTIELLTPVSTTEVKVVDLARKRYEKQILPLTEITYGGKKKRFDLAYCQAVKQAFDQGAFPYIPVKLAAKDNAHTNDVLRTGGRLVGLSVSESDGLVAELELNDDGIKAVSSSDGLVPVSSKIFEQLERNDGDHAQFDAALAHILITDDPYVRGMEPWKELDAVALSENRESVTETIDLSANHFGTEENMTEKKATVTLELTVAQQARLIELANSEEELGKLGLTPEQFEEAPESETEEEVDEEDEDTEDAPEAKVTLSRSATAEIELARTEAAEAKAQTLQLARQLQMAGIDREMDELARKGLAPAILALARPALEQPQAIELSRDGKRVKTDSGAVMREVLSEVIELARTGHDVVDFDKLSGVLVEDEDTTEKQMTLQLSALRTQFDD